MKRIYQIAKEYNISSKAIIDMLHSMSIDIKNHMSVVPDEILDKVKAKFQQEVETVKKSYEKIKLLHIEGEAKTDTPPAETEDGYDEDQIKLAKTEKVDKFKKAKKFEKGKIFKGGVKKDIVKDESEIKESIKKTMAKMSQGRKLKKYKKTAEDLHESGEDSHIIHVPEFISTSELATILGVDPSLLISKSLELGIMATINQRLDMDLITLLAGEYGFKVHKQMELDVAEEEEEEDDDTEIRPPVVTIMGHVDHGKTTLLDYIRKTNVVSTESGGITQHIGAYQVIQKDRKITFIDTPGHEAFTAMRARGAQITDIVVLVVAADDGIMPRTEEAINHARAADVPIIVAINKMDLPSANLDRTKQQLADHGLMVEEWGGDTLAIPISAKKGANIDKLLEMILLVAELSELKGNPQKNALGVIVEAKLDKGRGAVGTLLIQNGTLHIGDNFVCGYSYGKVRAMFDDCGVRINVATISQPAQIVGFSLIPNAGDKFNVVESETVAKQIANKRMQIKRERDFRAKNKISLENLYDQIKSGETKELNIVIKADVDGSIEAIDDSLKKLSNAEVKINIIHKGVGGINDADIMLASASNAVIVGFRVRPSGAIKDLANKENISIRTYEIIYEVINDIESSLKGMLAPIYEEISVGECVVRDTFHIPKVGTVAGCYIRSGVIRRNTKIRIVRDGIILYQGGLGSLKRFKEDVREVGTGYECGLKIEGFNDIKVGDLLEQFEKKEIKRQ